MIAKSNRLIRLIPMTVLAVFSFGAQAALAADSSSQHYSITPVPAWVESHNVRQTESDMSAIGGARLLLFDRQYRYDGNNVAYHRHSITEVTGQAGLSNNSKLSIGFDPGYQHLELHSVVVLRDGAESDRLEKARVDIARTEERSDQNLLSGEVTALVVLPDIRVGDRVEVRYTVFGRNPVFDDRHHSSWWVRWGVPIDRSVLSVTVPASMALTHTPRPEAEFNKHSKSGLQTLRWQWDGLKRSKVEKNTTDWYPSEDRLEVTAFNSWEEVAEWGAKLFAGHAQQGPLYQQLTKRIQAKSESQGRDAAIAMAIDHVQQRIRYFGLELGENSHRPHSPDTVLQNGYGDCKDKALLLVSLLKDIGIDAWPILVSARTRRGIVNRLPSPGVFDHAIVVAEVDGQQHWIDATSSSQKGLLGQRGQPEYGAGLILGKSGDALIKKSATMPSLPDISTHDQVYFSSLGGPVDFITTTTYRGGMANWFRYKLDKSGRQDREEKHEEYYSDIYGKLEIIEPIQISHNDINNSVQITTSYRMQDFWTVDKYSKLAEYDTYAIGLISELDKLPKLKSGRKAPLAMAGPHWATHRIQFYTAIAVPDRPLEEGSFAIDGFNYRDAEFRLGNSFVFDSELKINVDEIKASQAKAYTKFRSRVRRRAQSGRYIKSVDTNALLLGKDTKALIMAMEGLHQ